MKWGPRPSRAVVDAGASTQFFLKKELPMTKVVRCRSLRLAAGREKAFWAGIDGGGLTARQSLVRAIGRNQGHTGGEHSAGQYQGKQQFHIGPENDKEGMAAVRSCPQGGRPPG